jgi:small-conductance mechanosensitive channel
MSGFFVSLIILLAGLYGAHFLMGVLVKRLESRGAGTALVEDGLRILRGGLMPLLYLFVVYIAVEQYAEEGLGRVFYIAVLVTGGYYAVNLLLAVTRYALALYGSRRGLDEEAMRDYRKLMPVATVIVWGVVLAFVLDNLGFKVSTVVTGLGIGGIAVALAAQNVLGDLFSYMTILLDRPFKLGDFIVAGDHMGTVEHLGLKSTRIRSLGGEEIVLSNSDLTGARIRNFKRMQERRVIFGLGVVYQTPPDVVEQVPALVREAIESTPGTRFDRSHFKGFGPSSIDMEAVYYVLSAEYNVFMDVQQAINLKLLREFQARGIAFAYPTQTVFVEGQTRAYESSSSRLMEQ